MRCYQLDINFIARPHSIVKAKQPRRGNGIPDM